MRKFNTAAVCLPKYHYMVDLTDRLRQIKEMVDDGKYFTINRARQYGKTTTLKALEEYLADEYLVISLDFQLIGDSTFLHTGVNSLMNMVYNQATGTVMILDNSTTGMTGHQDHAATGKTLQGDPTYAIDIYNLIKAMGIEHVVEVNAFDIKKLEQVIKEEVARDEVSVIITKSPCVLLKGNVFPNKCKPVPEKCKKCGMCLKPGCPALTRNEDGTISIDDTMCNGCGLCQNLCPFGAIETVAK